MTIDPLIAKAIALGLGLMFALGAFHKLSTMDQFKVIISEYQLLPAWLAASAAWMIASVESALAVGWIFLPTQWLVPAASVALLLTYTMAIGVNLARGRIHISCGCSFSGRDDSDQQLSSGLLGRNAVLVALALVTTLPAIERDFTFGDYWLLAAALLASTLLYAAGNQLLSNGAAIGTWRNKHE